MGVFLEVGLACFHLQWGRGFIASSGFREGVEMSLVSLMCYGSGILQQDYLRCRFWR